MMVVIPCYDEPDIVRTLNSLSECSQPKSKVEIIVVINAPENASKETLDKNRHCYDQLQQWQTANSPAWMKLFVLLEESLPKKIAGVGLARKIGMDEAAFRFEQAGTEHGIILCLDADCTVDPNYLKAIEAHYQRYPETKATSIYFEHPLEGLKPETCEGIINYELHLRYYIQALRYSNYPFAYHTIGSSMTVRSDIYQKQGGMNKRKAGEDFYFLHKLMPLGDFYEINDTVVYPSPRISDRVPFGTGKAMGDWYENNSKKFLSYSPRIFEVLKTVNARIGEFYPTASELAIEAFLQSLPSPAEAYFSLQGFTEKILEIKRHTGNKKTFLNRFYRWFNGFRVLKFVHFARDEFYPNVPVQEAAWELCVLLHKKMLKKDNLLNLLKYYRKLDLGA